VFDGALLLGVCDKIVPGLLIGALHFGHLPCVFVPAGPMGTGLSNNDKSKVREQYAQGLVGRDALLAGRVRRPTTAPAPAPSTAPPTATRCCWKPWACMCPARPSCTRAPPLREALTREAVRTVLGITRARTALHAHRPLVDERCIVNAMVALLATGGSTNHLIHWVAVARSGGHPDRLDRLCRAVGRGAAAGPRVPQRQRRREPVPGRRRPRLRAARAARRRPHAPRRDASVARGGMAATAACRAGRLARPGDETGSCPGGAAVLAHRRAAPAAGQPGPRGDQGLSAVPEDRLGHRGAGARVRFARRPAGRLQAGELDRDVVAVVRFQGPQANGMPELHKLTPPLAVLQTRASRWRWSPTGA
jgi:phosphogluconate dehydratase